MVVDLNALLGLFFVSVLASFACFIAGQYVCDTHAERIFVNFWTAFFGVVAVFLCVFLIRVTLFSPDAVFMWVDSGR